MYNEPCINFIYIEKQVANFSFQQATDFSEREGRYKIIAFYSGGVVPWPDEDRSQKEVQRNGPSY